VYRIPQEPPPCERLERGRERGEGKGVKGDREGTSGGGGTGLIALAEMRSRPAERDQNKALVIIEYT
jgi:hypothetical protein